MRIYEMPDYNAERTLCEFEAQLTRAAHRQRSREDREWQTLQEWPRLASGTDMSHDEALGVLRDPWMW